MSIKKLILALASVGYSCTIAAAQVDITVDYINQFNDKLVFTVSYDDVGGTPSDVTDFDLWKADAWKNSALIWTDVIVLNSVTDDGTNDTGIVIDNMGFGPTMTWNTADTQNWFDRFDTGGDPAFSQCSQGFLCPTINGDGAYSLLDTPGDFDSELFTVVPLPASILFMLPALASLVGFSRYKKKQV